MRLTFDYFEHIDGPQSFRSAGRTLLCKGGGGGGGSSYYEEANRLYGVQADTGEWQLGLAKQYVPGLLQSMNADTEISREKQDRMAGEAIASIEQSNKGAVDAFARQATGLGVSANNVGTMLADNQRSVGLQRAAVRPAITRYAEDQSWARRSDMLNASQGQATTAASNLAAAAGGLGNIGNAIGNQQAQQNAATGQAVGNAVMGGYGLYQMMKKDGGYIKAPQRERRFALGGLAARMGVNSAAPPMPAPSPQQSQGPGVGDMIGIVKNGVSAAKGGGSPGIGSAIEELGNATGSSELSSFGAGVRLGKGADGAVAAYEGAAADAGAAALGGEAAGGVATGAEVAGGVAGAAEAATAATVATEVGAAGSAMGAGAAIGAALPWVGLAVAAGSALGLFADGGAVECEYIPADNTKRKDMTRGGKVKGPGTGTSDSIPARLSDGEYVLNAETVKMVGVPALEKLNNAGLEKRYGGEQKFSGGGLAAISGLGAGLMGAYQMQRQSERDKIEQERFGMEKDRFGREQSEYARQQQMRDDYRATMGQIAGAANSAAKIQQGLTSGKLAESDALLQGVEAYNAFTTDPRKMAVAPDGKSVLLYGPDGKVASATSAKDALATMLSPQGADHVLMSGYQRLAEKYPEYADKWQAVFRDVRNSAREDKKVEQTGKHYDQQYELGQGRNKIAEKELGIHGARLGIAQAEAGREAERFTAGAPARQLAQTLGTAQLALANETDPETRKAIQAKIADLQVANQGKNAPHVSKVIYGDGGQAIMVMSNGEQRPMLGEDGKPVRKGDRNLEVSLAKHMTMPGSGADQIGAALAQSRSLLGQGGAESGQLPWEKHKPK